MNKRLKYDEFVPDGEDLIEGEQIHINHEDCPAGQDTKRRLYIKREVENGTDILLAYCHHCNQSGYYVLTKKAGTYTRAKPSSNTGSSSAEYAGLRIKDWDGWHPRAKGWTLRYDITSQEITDQGISYCPEYDKLYLPIKKSGKTIGYQLRSLDGSEPKYETTAFEKPLFWYDGADSDTLVIVEDILSAIKCSRYTGSLALLSSGMSDQVFEFISRSRHSNFIVFLDYDNRQVRSNVLNIAGRLALLGPTKIIHNLGKDPKECDDEELKVLLLC